MKKDYLISPHFSPQCSATHSLGDDSPPVQQCQLAASINFQKCCISAASPAAGQKWEPGMTPELSLKTTLVVVPDNLRKQWLEELRKHVRPGALKW